MASERDPLFTILLCNFACIYRRPKERGLKEDTKFSVLQHFVPRWTTSNRSYTQTANVGPIQP